MSSTKKLQRRLLEPVQSDKTILMNVEDLISATFGSIKENTVNFKLLQAVLNILARQMRLLEQDVEIHLDSLMDDSNEDKPASPKKGSKDKYSSSDDYSTQRSRSKSKDDSTSLRSDGKRSKDRKGKSPSDEKGSRDRKRDQVGRGNDEDDRGQVRRRDSITVIERDRGGKDSPGDKVLVATRETLPDGRLGRPRIGSIDVVTASEFELMQKQVQTLQSVAAPPMPTMPDNQQLREALAKGTASLPDTMEAMQLKARVEAAESAVSRMTELLTQLAAMGVLPPEMAAVVASLKADTKAATKGGAGGTLGAGRAGGVGGAPGAGGGASGVGGGTDSAGGGGGGADGARGGFGGTGTSRSESPLGVQWGGTTTGDSSVAGSRSRTSKGSRPTSSAGLTGPPSRAALLAANDYITLVEFMNLMQSLEDDLMNKARDMSGKAANAADAASRANKQLADKLDVAMRLDSRISLLESTTAEYNEQIKGLDQGLEIQLASFRQQIGVLSADLRSGLEQMGTANNSESAALQDLTQRYHELLADLDEARYKHTLLTIMKNDLATDFSRQREFLEILRDQKADYDELRDALRDKASISHLVGLLNADIFEEEKEKIDLRLELCYLKFKKQDRRWMEAMKEMMCIVSKKADAQDLWVMRHDATEQLEELREKLDALYNKLGEPAAALLARKLSADAHCGACLTPALMYARAPPAPPRAPALRPPPPAPPAPRASELHWQPAPPPLPKVHMCNRYVGGSHTLLVATREKAEPVQLPPIPTRKFLAIGEDGKSYKMEEKCHPCAECSDLAYHRDADLAAGDTVVHHSSPTGGEGDDFDNTGDGGENKGGKEGDF